MFDSSAATGKKKIFVWDVDGVILDSAKETHLVTLMAVERHKAEIENTFKSSLGKYSYEDFYKDRPYVDKAHEYFMHYFKRSFEKVPASRLESGEKHAFYSKYKPLFEKLGKEFYNVRKEMQDKDLKKWHDLNPVYQGIPEAMRVLKDNGFEFVVVSSKDKASIWSALQHHGLSSYFKQDNIIDTTQGESRIEQMKKLMEKFGDAEYVVIDDLPDNHLKSRQVLGNKAKYIGAKWGYGVGWDKQNFILAASRPEDIAKQLRLRAMAKEYITQHRKIMKVPFLGSYVFGNKVTREEADEKKLEHVIVYLLIKDKQGNVVLQKRASSKKDYPNMLSISASGAVKHLESIEKAAVREAWEELGIRVRNVKPLWEKPVKLDPANPHRLYFTLVAEYAGNLKPNPVEVEAQGTRYYSSDEVTSLIHEKKLTPPAENFFNEAKERLKKQQEKSRHHLQTHLMLHEMEERKKKAEERKMREKARKRRE